MLATRLLAFAIVAVVGGVAVSGWMRHETGRRERAIQNALRYFEERTERLHPVQYQLLSFFERKFRAPELHRILHPMRSKTTRLYERGQLKVFHRLVEPTVGTDIATIDKLPRIPRIMARALHCERIELPSSFLNAVSALEREGGYSLTHAVLALQWALDNGCLRASEVPPVQQRQAEALRSLLRQQGVSTDLGVETLAVLLYVSGSDPELQLRVQQLVRSQRADGGWAPAVDGKRSTDHTTVLALWALLESERSPIVGERMVPSGSASGGGGR